MFLTQPPTNDFQLNHTPTHHHPPGDKRNAIPREASADILVPAAHLAAAKSAVAARLVALKEVYGTVEPDLALELAAPGDGAPVTGDALVVTPPSVDALVSMLAALPHGPVRMSPAMAGLVETSNNVASVKPPAAPPASGPVDYTVVVSTRSSIPAALADERLRIAAVAKMAGAAVHQPPDYAGCESLGWAGSHRLLGSSQTRVVENILHLLPFQGPPTPSLACWTSQRPPWPR
jgi:dipeptidase D